MSIKDEIVKMLEKQRSKLLWTGIFMAIAGVVALVYPQITTIVIELFIGWMLVFYGFLALFNSFLFRGVGPFFGAFLFALFTIAAGVFLLWNPISGSVALTLVVAFVFIVDGASKVGLAFDLKPFLGWVWLLLSGIVSGAVGILIAAGLPDTSAFTLGILVGIVFLTSGVGYIMVAKQLKKVAA